LQYLLLSWPGGGEHSSRTALEHPEESVGYLQDITTYTSPIPRHMPLDFLGGKVCILDPEAEWRRVLNSLDVVLSDIMGTWDLSKDLWSDD